jgi:P27 family predicted phage terminase small subunit
MKTKTTTTTPQSTTTPPPPDWLPASAKDVWRDLAPILTQEGRLLPHQTGPFTAYCVAAGSMRDAAGEIARLGITIPGRSGTLVKNPACSVFNSASQQLLALAKHFGLTPVSRAKLDKAQPRPRTTTSKFDDL